MTCPFATFRSSKVSAGDVWLSGRRVVFLSFHSFTRLMVSHPDEEHFFGDITGSRTKCKDACRWCTLCDLVFPA
jgi:hypothetical protein